MDTQIHACIYSIREALFVFDFAFKNKYSVTISLHNLRNCKHIQEEEKIVKYVPVHLISYHDVSAVSDTSYSTGPSCRRS